MQIGCILFTHSAHMGCFHRDPTSNAVVSSDVQISLRDFAFKSFVDMNRIGISGPYSSGSNVLFVFF